MTSPYRHSARAAQKLEHILRAETDGEGRQQTLVDVFLDVDGSLVVQVYTSSSTINDQPNWQRARAVRFAAKDGTKLSVAQLTLARPDLLAANALDGSK